MRTQIGCWLSFTAVLLGAFALIAASIYILETRPWMYAAILLTVVVSSVTYDAVAKHRVLNRLNTRGYSSFAIDQPVEYIGVYRPHWEIGHIAIPLARRRLGIFPVFESWCPRLETPNHEDCLPDGDGPFIIRFVGRVSERGTYGHMGSMNRKVIVERVLDSQRLQSSR